MDISKTSNVISRVLSYGAGTLVFPIDSPSLLLPLSDLLYAFHVGHRASMDSFLGEPRHADKLIYTVKFADSFVYSVYAKHHTNWLFRGLPRGSLILHPLPYSSVASRNEHVAAGCNNVQFHGKLVP
jgi:hypothetical protein